jgi:hypothetical protein
MAPANAPRKIQKRPLDLLKPTLLILTEHRSALKVLRFQHAHTRTAICIPKPLCGELSSGQHPTCFHNLLHPKMHDAVWFLLWWLFLHRRLRARQRGSASEDLSDLAPDRLIIPDGRYPFLSG